MENEGVTTAFPAGAVCKASGRSAEEPRGGVHNTRRGGVCGCGVGDRSETEGEEAWKDSAGGAEAIVVRIAWRRCAQGTPSPSHTATQHRGTLGAVWVRGAGAVHEQMEPTGQAGGGSSSTREVKGIGCNKEQPTTYRELEHTTDVDGSQGSDLQKKQPLGQHNAAMERNKSGGWERNDRHSAVAETSNLCAGRRENEGKR